MQVQLVKNTPKPSQMTEPIGGFWSGHPSLSKPAHQFSAKNKNLLHTMFGVCVLYFL